MLAQLTETVELIDKASAQNDRWLFLASLVLLLCFVGLVIKWLVNHIDAKDRRLEAKEAAHDAKLKEAEREATEERKEARAKFLESIDSNRKEVTAMAMQIAELTKLLTKHDHDMRDAHRIETATLVRAELLKLGITPDKLAGIG